MQIIGRSLTAHQVLQMKKLMENLIWQVKHSSPMLLTRMAFLGINFRLHNPELLDAIVVRMAGEVHEMRFKDMERICLVLSTFDHITEAAATLLGKISSHLLSVEKLEFVDCVIRCIEYLLRCGVYNAKLIEWALDREKIIDSFDISTRCALLNIDMFTKIVYADEYEGPNLSDSECADIASKRLDVDEGDWSQLHSIVKLLKASGQNCVLAHALPHFVTPGKLKSMLR